jgi:hypothetical protein
MIHEYTI